MSQEFTRELSYSVADSRVDLVNALFRRVYQWMAIGLILTAITAYGVASNGTLIRMFYGSSMPFFVAIATLGLVFVLSGRIQRISAGVASALFVIYSVLNGLLCSGVLLLYAQESVYSAFFSTAGMFAVMSVYGLYTRRDLTSLGSFLYMGLTGLIISGLVNLFVRSTMVEFVTSIVGILVFLGLTAFDTQMIRQMGEEIEDGEDGVMIRKVAVLGALSLYLDFINIFLYLLRLFGKRR